MEYSLKEPGKPERQFDTLQELFDFIKSYGELDGWVIRVHHL